MSKIWIGYYSKTGTTLKVCQTVLEKLHAADFEVDMVEFDQMKDIQNYDTVILAAPINGMQWVEAAKTFVQHHGDILQQKRVIVVYVSYIVRTGNQFWQKKIRKGIESLTSSLNPMLIRDFGGVIEGDFPAFARWIFGIPKGTPLDVSNHQEVETFANDLIQRLS